MASLGVDPSFAEAMGRGATVKQELLKRAGGGLTTTQVADALGITRQAVDKRRRRRALLAVPAGSGGHIYPACQFTPDGAIPGFARLLQAFQIKNSWMQLSALLSPAPGVGGKNFLEALKAGDVEKAIAVVASFGEQAA